MNRLRVASFFSILIFACSNLLAQNSDLSKQAELAKQFLQSLSASDQQKASFPFNDKNRKNWHFVPTSQYDRDGIALKDLKPNQKQKLENLLQGFLSKDGYKKVQDIMSFEYILQKLEPGNSHRIPENYKIAIYGRPGIDTVWGWKYGGHHLGLHFTVVGNQVAYAPFFFGSNPGTVLDGPQKGVRLLGVQEDLGFQLVNSLNSTQEKSALLQAEAFPEIISAQLPEATPLSPSGISFKELNSQQQEIIHQILIAYLFAMPPKIAKWRMDKIAKEDQDAISFGWAGAKEKGKGHYYRIQGKTFLIEFDNTQNNANHIHTVWRDFNGDFGTDLLREHYHNDHAQLK